MDTEGMAAAGADAGPDQPWTPPLPLEPPRRRMSWRGKVATGVAMLLGAGVIAGFVVRVPYTTIAPGDALSLPSRVSVQGARSYTTPRGDIRLLFVREAYHVNVWQYVRAWLDSDIDLARDGDVNPSNLTPAQQEAQGFQQMADAKNSATYVALTAAGYKVPLAPGLTVNDLVPGMPAIEVLTWGDVIISAAGHKITGSRDLDAVIAAHKVGDHIPVVVERAGKPVTVQVRIGVFTDAPLKGRKGIGVELAARFAFPVKVHVDTTGIGGPSAGLAMTLAILDDLTPGDLTGGKRVAVTGTIDAQGHVGEIGGIQQKAVAARKAHVSMFIVPQCAPTDPAPYLASCKADLVGAAKRAGDKIKIVPVSTFAQALAALRAAGGSPVTQTAPTTSTTLVA